jgi:hypothetical protein
VSEEHGVKSDEDIIKTPQDNQLDTVVPMMKEEIKEQNKQGSNLEQPKQPKPFLRWDNKVLWVIGLSLGFVILLLIVLGLR